MLHAFDAASGNELFAYLPLALRPQWPRFPTSAFAASPYAEGGLAAGNALVRGARRPRPCRQAAASLAFSPCALTAAIIAAP